MKKLLIATNNTGKIEELRALLDDLSVELVTPADLNLKLDVTENGKTYAESAQKKALAFARASELISLADDSGLEVEALAGAPGLYSARYSPPPSPFIPPRRDGGRVRGGHTDADRRAYLLQNLKDKPRPWRARFHATIAVATPDQQVRFAEGDCAGEIIPEERGRGGFGYDPIFLLPELGRTMAELAPDEKNRLSHRARAVMNAKPILIEMLGA